MKQHTRRAVAYIAGRIISNQPKTSIYDYSSSKHYAFSGNIISSQINIYDHEENCHVNGSLPNLYHYNNKKDLTLNINNNTFSGYDYDTSTHFSGSANGNIINIYDNEFSTHFSYSM